jgi:endonuclease YncB( thermonuclease family)
MPAKQVIGWVVTCRPAVVPKRAAVIAVAAAASVGGWWLGEQRSAANPRVRVVEVVDGDTIVVELPDGDTDTVRILGVDTPKIVEHHLRRTKVWKAGSSSSDGPRQDSQHNRNMASQ